MDIILKVVGDKSIYLINFLRLFNTNIYFLRVNSNNNKKLSNKLKSLNVRALPVADEKNIPYEIWDNINIDSKNLLLKKVNIINSKKITKLFLKSISFNSEKAVKLLIKQSITNDFTLTNGLIDIWLRKKKKVIFLIL